MFGHAPGPNAEFQHRRTGVAGEVLEEDEIVRVALKVEIVVAGEGIKLAHARPFGPRPITGYGCTAVILLLPATAVAALTSKRGKGPLTPRPFPPRGARGAGRNDGDANRNAGACPLPQTLPIRAGLFLWAAG